MGKPLYVFLGWGGVGSYAAEALARSGIGSITLVDGDTVSKTNINRQLAALVSTVGKFKADVMAERIKDINPNVKVACHNVFYTPENAGEMPLGGFDYVVDAIDMVTSKLEIIERAHVEGTPVISAMGMGNKLEPTMIEVKDISETSVCPLARVMRRELKKRGIGRLKVVCSAERPVKKRGDGSRPARERGVCAAGGGADNGGRSCQGYRFSRVKRPAQAEKEEGPRQNGASGGGRLSPALLKALLCMPSSLLNPAAPLTPRTWPQ